MAETQQLVTEVPSSLKQLARLVARGFYTIEDALVVDMLVRNPCMKEDDICELLKFERKMLRSRIAGLKNDKFIQVRLRMETGPDGKAQKVNYYFINYKVSELDEALFNSLGRNFCDFIHIVCFTDFCKRSQIQIRCNAKENGN